MLLLQLTLTVEQKFISLQSLLERRAHKGVTRARIGQEGKMDVEDREVQEEGKYNERDSSCSEMSPKVFLPCGE